MDGESCYHRTLPNFRGTQNTPLPLNPTISYLPLPSNITTYYEHSKIYSSAYILLLKLLTHIPTQRSMATTRLMTWDPTQFFRTEEGLPSSPYALLILNHPINERAYDVLQQHGMPPYPYTLYKTLYRKPYTE